MIGEPEIDGDWDTAGPAAVTEVEPEPSRERVRGPRAPWLWALGGVVVASAVWAGALAAQDRFSSAPRIDYRHSGDLCKEVDLKVLGQTVGRTFEGRQSGEGVDPAQDWAYCHVGMRYEKGSVLYATQVLVELHKKGDPAEEFASGPGTTPGTRLNLGERREVPGLGDRAVLDPYYADSGKRLMVLDGGAVFTATVEWYQQTADEGGVVPGGAAGVDEDAIEAAMIEDVRALMAKLRR
ncbi:hypothetical protein J7F03_25835 [Streptomyces sp. ISL-43]|uniref:hypothetical protein n=1 Tax=Streptomyces sp. ISL-43 TaxID=2819183 RepID=UPI001BEB944D|nr:hypothetical protein [Streptomyces sp. ISL-43]MBT2450436.1 hypothetical protein [Streptomyces sp. ISL-43]